MIETVVEPENMWLALKQVERNSGAAGVDNMTVEQLRAYLREYWPRIKEELLAGTYQPQPVRKVEITKPGREGMRMLGIPTVIDRLIQQALHQVLNPLFEPSFSESSYGFRPQRSAQPAVLKAREYVREGRRWVVDIDLEKFFDRVNHDVLMSRLARRIKDKRVLRLIRRYLQATSGSTMRARVRRVKTDQRLAAEFRRRYSIPEERAIVTQVSWIIPEKGIADFLEAARLVLQQNRNVHFVLVGDGVHREQYMEDAATMGLGDHITWTGMVDDPFGEGVFHAADVVCQFSRWEEVFGWMIAESMAHGKPVVATRVGGIPELITDGVSGHLVDRGDTSAMSDRILTLLADPELRERMGEAGRETVSKKFDLRKNVAQLIASYGVS